MNFKTTAILIALLLVVGAVWLFSGRTPDVVETPTPGVEQTAAQETRYVLAPRVEADQIVGLTIARPDQPTMRFVRAPQEAGGDELGDWRAVEPVETPAETWMVNSLATTFANLESRKRYEAGEEGRTPEEAGLAPPAATVTLTDRAGKTYTIEVGRKAAMAQDTYVRVQGQAPIHLAQRDLTQEVRREFNEYRSKRLMPFTAENATRVRIDAAGQTLLFTRGADNEWVIDEPVKAHAQADQVLSLLRKLSGLRAQEFVPQTGEDLEALGLATSDIHLVVTTETERTLPAEQEAAETQPAEPRTETVTETHELFIGGFADLQQEKRYARVAQRPGVVTLTQKDVQDLIPDLTRFRDPRIARVAAGAITRLGLEVDGTSAILQRAGGGWTGEGDLQELEMAAVSDLLEAFEDLRAIEYLTQPADPAEFGLAEPRAVVTAMATGSIEPVTIRVGNRTPSGRHAYVERLGQPTIFVVSAAQADRLVVPPLSLRSRELVNVEPERLQRLEIHRGQRLYRLEREQGAWRLITPAEAPIDRESVRLLVNDLSRLRARRVVAKDDAAAYGLDDPRLVMEFTVAAPPAPAAEAGPAETQPAESAELETGEAETQPGETGDVEPASEAATVTPEQESGASEPAPETGGQALVQHPLRVAEHETVVYGQLDDSPYIFEIDPTVYRVLNAELIDRKLFPFEPLQIAGISIIGPGGALEFTRAGEEWTYPADPFVELAQPKVEELIESVAGLRVDQYLEYEDADLQAAGLLAAPVTVSIRLISGQSENLKLEQAARGELPRLAGWVEKKRTFLLRPADVEKLLRGLDAYIKSEEAPAAEPQMPGMQP